MGSYQGRYDSWERNSAPKGAMGKYVQYERKWGDGTKQDISVLEAAGFLKAAFMASSETQQNQGILNLFAVLLVW